MTHSRPPKLIQALCRCDAWPHDCDEVQLLETHISWVLLVGDYAYKIKKPVDFGFLDFSTLEKRHHFCNEELRLNSRLAPELYLGVVHICGTEEIPELDTEAPALEYAVKMRRFDQEALLSNRISDLSAGLMEELAKKVAAFHAGLPGCAIEEPYGDPQKVMQPMLDNFRHLRELGQPEKVGQRLEQLEHWTVKQGSRLSDVIARRKSEGHVKECHGDMHLGNMALVEQQPVIFDGIDFNPSLCWIDTVSEIAFLIMDLQEKKLPGLASRFLNTYLELSGDYDGLLLLRFYQVYRAMVRAKVTALSLQQTHDEQLQSAMLEYLSLAEGYMAGNRVGLIITSGVSGSGKSYTAQLVTDQLPAIHLRSDIERKRLAGLPPLEASDSAANEGIYTSDFTARTYLKLLDLARLAIESGNAVVVDATFLKIEWRRRFSQLADELECPFVVLDIDAPEAVLRDRIANRLKHAKDPSEADEKILASQLSHRELLTPGEQKRALKIRPDKPFSLEALNAHLN